MQAWFRMGAPGGESVALTRLAADRISCQTCQTNRVSADRAVYQTAVITGLSNLKFSNRHNTSFIPLSYDLINIACPSEILSNDLYSNNSFKSNIPSTLLSPIKADTNIGLILIY
jgi:hypothetical protein